MECHQEQTQWGHFPEGVLCPSEGLRQPHLTPPWGDISPQDESGPVPSEGLRKPDSPKLGAIFQTTETERGMKDYHPHVCTSLFPAAWQVPTALPVSILLGSHPPAHPEEGSWPCGEERRPCPPKPPPVLCPVPPAPCPPGQPCSLATQ